VRTLMTVVLALAIACPIGSSAFAKGGSGSYAQRRDNCVSQIQRHHPNRAATGSEVRKCSSLNRKH
jgi:hypothetical protein